MPSTTYHSIKRCMRCNDAIKPGEPMNSIATQRDGVVRALLLCEDCGESLETWLGEPPVKWSTGYAPSDGLFETAIAAMVSNPEPVRSRFLRASELLQSKDKRIRFPALEPKPSIEQLSVICGQCDGRGCRLCWNPEGEIDA